MSLESRILQWLSFFAAAWEIKRGARRQHCNETFKKIDSHMYDNFSGNLETKKYLLKIKFCSTEICGCSSRSTKLNFQKD